MKTISIEINYEQAKALLDCALSGIQDALGHLEGAIDNITHYDAQDGKFCDMQARYSELLKHTHKTIDRLDSIAKAVFPLFNEEE